MLLQRQCGPHLRRSRKIDRRDPRECHLFGFACPLKGLRRIEDFKTSRCAIIAEIHYGTRPHLVAFADSCLAKGDAECAGMRIVFGFHVQSTATGYFSNFPSWVMIVNPSHLA